MAMIASKCPHIEVYVVDISESRIAAWNSERIPIFEPGLDEKVKQCRGRNLFFTTDIATAIAQCDIIFVSVNTPTKKSGIGAGRAANLSPWEMAGRMIAKFSTTDKIVVEKSTVPVRTAAALQKVLEHNNVSSNSHTFTILSNPEFLAEGTAMRDLEFPDRVLIGGDQIAGQTAVNVLVDIYAHWVDRSRIITTNVWSSELSKLVANAFLAQRVSSINAVSLLCEKTGADVTEVAKAIGTDSRIGGKFLQASVGFGGSCFQKDILNLVYLCEAFGLSEVGAYWEGVVKTNEFRKVTFVKNIIESLFNTVDSKKIAILGFAFKKDTSDTRETAAITVCEGLMRDGALLHVFDPKVTHEQALIEFSDHGIDQTTGLDLSRQFVFCSSAEEATRNAHAIVVLTEWDEFRDYDFGGFFQSMEKPAFVFDGRNLLDHRHLFDLGFEVHRIGSPPLRRTAHI